LTQQVARRLYLSEFSGPLPERKAREALIALQLDARYSKDEILELYLNSVYYGNGAYGVEAAARVYFGVSAANLDLAQAAFLAGLPQMPAVYGGEPNGHAARA
jgi:membrane peptidoglycan carboxypeptidase